MVNSKEKRKFPVWSGVNSLQKLSWETFTLGLYDVKIQSNILKFHKDLIAYLDCALW